MSLNLDRTWGDAAGYFGPQSLPAFALSPGALRAPSRRHPAAAETPSPFAGCDRNFPPAKLLADVRTALDLARDAIREDFELASDGIRTARLHSELMDALVRHLLDLAEQRVPPVARGVPGRQLAVAAVGGYGRAQLAPASDLDLLFLIPPQPSIHSIQAIEFVLYRLWDLGLRVGHAVRSCGECVSVARSDWRTATSLLDLRHLWGRRPLYDALESSFRAEVAKNGEVLISALLCDLAKRRARFRDPEAPDLKRGPGGLRDLQTLCWLAKIRRPLRQPDLTSAAALDDSGARDAIGFLWSVRCHLHYLSGGAQERLSLDLQPEIARRMLGKALPERRSTAAFMRRFWRASRWVEGLSARWLRQ